MEIDKKFYMDGEHPQATNVGEPRPLPTLELNPDVTDLFAFTIEPPPTPGLRREGSRWVEKENP